MKLSFSTWELHIIIYKSQVSFSPGLCVQWCENETNITTCNYVNYVSKYYLFWHFASHDKTEHFLLHKNGDWYHTSKCSCNVWWLEEEVIANTNDNLRIQQSDNDDNLRIQQSDISSTRCWTCQVWILYTWHDDTWRYSIAIYSSFEF